MSIPNPSPESETPLTPVAGAPSLDASAHNGEPDMSPGLRFLNLFVAPTELFEHLARVPARPMNWILPLLLNCIAIVAFTLISFSNPSVVQETRDLQSRQLDKLVSEGKITAEQRNQQVEAMEKFSSVVPLIGSIAGAVGMVLFAFITGAVVWLVANKALRVPIDFAKSMDISGVVGLISVPGTLVKLALVMLRGSINVGANLGIFFPDVPMGSPLATALAGCDFFILWTVALLALGVGTVTRRGFKTALPWFGGLWLGLMVLTIAWSAMTYSK